MDVLGIDFGTSNTVAVLLSAGRPPRVLAIDGSGWLPSSIYVEDDGSLAVGRDAERKARLAPERFEPNPKRRIDDGEILLGVRVVPVVDAIAAILRQVADEARRQLNGKSADQVHLTHPAQWGSARQNVLLAAARAAGLGPAVSLIPEPVAAAAHFASLPGKSLPAGSSLAVYDLGGGTFDCAVVGATTSGFTVLAESGLPDVGGVDFDQAIVDHLGRTISAEDPARWQALSRPRTASDRRAARTVREDVRAAKETLSRYAQTDLPLPDPFEDTLLTRKEFDGLVRPVIAKTVDVLAETVGRAGLSPDRLAGIYLVGGSSRIPLVASMITERLGVVAATLDQPETSVAMGAALAPANVRPQARTEFLGHGSGPAGPGPGPATAFAGSGGPAAGLGPGPGGPGGPPGVGSLQPGTAGAGQPGPTGYGPSVGSTTGVQPRSLVDRPGQPGGFSSGISGPPIGLQHPGAAGPGRNPHQSPTGPFGPLANGSGGAGNRRMQTILIAAIVVVIAVASTIIIVVSSSSSSADPKTLISTSSSASSFTGSSSSAGPSSSSAGTSSPNSSAAAGECDAKPNSVGLTGCLKLAAGKLADSGCTQDPKTLNTSADDLTSFTALTSAWTACIDQTNQLVTILLQTNNAAARDAVWPEVIKQFTESRSGNWRTTALTGVYSAGTTDDGDPVVSWKTDGQPVVAFLIAASTDKSPDELITIWRNALDAQVG